MPRSEHIDYLDGWRGLAILVVLVAHFGHLESTNLGLFGVELFFVLSGLLMARILYEQRMPIGEFYRRRIARIFPLFYLFVFTILIVAMARGAHVSWKEALSLSTFTRTYFGYVFDDPLPVHHLWSLNVEEHCYLLLALIAMSALLRRRAALTLITLSMLTFVAMGLHHLLQGHMKPYLYNTECAATALLLSAGYRLHRRVRVPPWAPVLALVLTPFFYLTTTPEATSVQLAAQLAIPPFLLAFAVNHLADSPVWFLNLLRARWLRLLGVISYSVYIWQQPFYLSSHRFPWHTAVLCALLTGLASFYLYENPSRRWLNTHWTGRARATKPRDVSTEAAPQPRAVSLEIASERMR
jgi:peptidoglycan/LPS O-acetylase OafA/YrhL